MRGKIASYSQFHKRKPSNHEELLALLGLLTINIGLINMNNYERLLEYQRSVPELHQFFGPVFTEYRRLLMLHSMLNFRQNEGESSI